MGIEKLSTPTKTHISKSAIVSPHSSPNENINLDIPSDQMDIDLQKITKVNNTHASLHTSSKGKISTETDKRSKTQVNLFAAHLDVNSLESFKKQKHLKTTIKSPTQSYLCLAVEQQRDKNYQSVYK